MMKDVTRFCKVEQRTRSELIREALRTYFRSRSGMTLEDYLEIRDPRVRRHIARSNRDYAAGRFRPAAELVAELRRETATRKSNARSAHRARGE